MGTMNDEHARYPGRDDARNREPTTPVGTLVEHLESEVKDCVRFRGNISVYMDSRISSGLSGSSSSAPKLTGTARCRDDGETVYQVDGEAGATLFYDHIVSKRQRRY